MAERKLDWHVYNEELVNSGGVLFNYMQVPEIITQIIDNVDPNLKHNETVKEIEQIFRKNKFYTTLEYPIFKIKDGSGRAGRIDLVARRGKFRIALEYDHKLHVKYKSFQKVTQIGPEVGIVIAGFGNLDENIARADGYVQRVNFPFYVVSLKEERFAVINEVRKWKDISNEWTRAAI